MQNTEFIDQKISLKTELVKYLLYWKLFLLSILITAVFAFFHLRYKKPIYHTNTIIKIQSDKENSSTELAAFQDLGISGGAEKNVKNEIEILKSRSLITKVIKDLGLNIQFMLKEDSFAKEASSFFKNTNPLPRELYTKKPLNINFFENDSTLFDVDTSFVISIVSKTKFNLKDFDDNIISKNTFGETITSSIGKFILIPNFENNNHLIGKDLVIKIVPINTLVNYYKQILRIESSSELVLKLSLNTPVRKKGEDILNTLIKNYNDEAIILKDEMSKKTSDFVNNRLKIIEDELTDVDDTAERFKSSNRVTDIASETGLNLQNDSENERRLSETSTQLQLVDALSQHITNEGDNKEFIPANLGFADNALSEITNKHNELIIERNRLLKSSTEKNPVVINLDNQINDLKQSLQQGLSGAKQSYQISLDNLNKQNAIISSKLYSSPGKARKLRVIERQQQTKEALFLYLLQKREETAISLGVAEPNAQVIDAAYSTSYPIAPNKKIVWIGALFIGLLVPTLYIYLKYLLDTKIHNREDLEKLLSIPIIADIPTSESKKQLSIADNDNSSMAEAFRILRTNLNFVLPNKNKCNLIFVTSTIASEGKSFISSNLAASLTFTNKKVLLVGMDIRAPKLSNYIKIRGKKGITNYILDENLTIEHLVINSPLYKDLDVISSGDIPPNPSELLMSPRIDQFFKSVREMYDYVIVDTAAASMVTDTTLISKYADTFLFVVRANHVDKRLLSFVKAMHSEKRYPNLSLLLNDVDHKKGYGYGYGYGYGQDFNKKPWWKRKKAS